MSTPPHWLQQLQKTSGGSASQSASNSSRVVFPVTFNASRAQRVSGIKPVKKFPENCATPVMCDGRKRWKGVLERTFIRGYNNVLSIKLTQVVVSVNTLWNRAREQVKVKIQHLKSSDIAEFVRDRSRESSSFEIEKA
eukprot:scaffold57976_cov56-Attheya_sp.AAC.4